MGSTSATVIRELTMDIVGFADGQALPVPVVLRYDTADPYAVSAEFRSSPDETVVWTFSRELMANGLSGPVGEGDVRISPSEPADQGVLIALYSEDGTAVVRAAASEVVDFLWHSYSLCPLGDEGRFVNIDAAVRALLRC